MTISKKNNFMNILPETVIPVRQGRLRVLMLTWEFPPNVAGGLSKHVFGLSKQLVQLGAEVCVVTAGGERLPLEEEQCGITVHRVKPLNQNDDSFLTWVGGLNMAMVFKTIFLAEKKQFSVIHAHDWLVGTAAILLKEALGLQLVTTIHATEFGRNGGIYNEIQRFIHEKEQRLIEKSDQVIVCSEYMRQELYDVFQNVDRIAVIPNGVDLETRKASSALEIIQGEQMKKIVFSIGRIVKEKGFETIIETAGLIKKVGLNICFVVAGKGPMLEVYRRQVIEKELGDYLFFIGYISEEEKIAYLTESEINVFPSLYEPFGIVALESMVQGKPTIVSNTGGLKGLVKHMETGLHMTPGNAESLLEQINFLLRNPKKAEEIGRKGREKVKSIYGWRQAAMETKRLIEELLNHM